LTAWIPAALGCLAALAAAGFWLARRRSAPGGPAADPKAGDSGEGASKGGASFAGVDIAMVTRITDKFPAILRSEPEPAVKPEKRANAGLQGNLAQTQLHDLLQYLALGHKSGILELVSGRRTGRVVLRDGRVYKNSYRGKDGMEAMFMMLDLAEGDFEFYEQTLEDSVSFSGLEVVDIIMLWMDRKPKKKA
jgi:uncharacterized protein DUF4388